MSLLDNIPKLPVTARVKAGQGDGTWVWQNGAITSGILQAASGLARHNQQGVHPDASHRLYSMGLLPAGMEVLIAGRRYEVLDCNEWPDLNGVIDHYEVALKDVTHG